jgi:hypothetical protein
METFANLDTMLLFRRDFEVYNEFNKWGGIVRTRDLGVQLSLFPFAVLENNSERDFPRLKGF